jgi:hypothetical protein
MMEDIDDGITDMKDKKPEEIFPFGCTKLTDWKFIAVKDTDMILYYNTYSDEEFAEESKDGFNFYCIWAHGWNSDEKIIACDCMFRGTAYWDGTRHLYFGDKQTGNYGYLYYPEIEHLILALKELMKLENKYCRMDD